MKTNMSVLVRNVAITLLFASVLPAVALAQTTSTTDDTASAVAAGQQVWQQLQAKQVSCSQLKDADYEHLGEYFMGQMMGSSHESMNAILQSRLGATGEEQMHTVMGKRLSGCDPQAAYPAGFQGFMPMMGGNGYGGSMMGYDGSNYYSSNYGNSMMNGYGYNGSMMGYGGYGFPFEILWWILIIVAIVTAVRWFSGGSSRWGKSALDILKERYAKGEIDKEEFEAKKKDLG